MRTIKKLTILFSTFAISCVLAGLGSCNKETPPPAPEPPPEEEQALEFIFPVDDNPIVWESPLSGDGAPFRVEDDENGVTAKGRFWCDEGYYKASLPANTEMFYEFQVFDTGLYALYTMSPVENLTITQYDASTQYIPTDSAGAFVGEQASTVPENYGEKAGVLYHKINCPKKYYNSNWRATYGIKSTVEQTIELRFVRIGDALPVPETITTKVEPTELKGKFANDPNANTTNMGIVNVPWNAEYFYDENYEIEVTPFAGGDTIKVKGFYRMGTKENPKDLIYVMLTENPPRMFDTTFTQLTSKGASLNLYTATAENGDYLVNDYYDFIMRANGNSKKVCYENAVNGEGLYPVNQELFAFLNYYVDARGCAGMTEDQKTQYPDAMWLAPCYYYGNLQNGTQSHPFALKVGSNAITLENENFVFYNVKWKKETNTLTGKEITEGYYQISCSTPGVIVKFTNDISHKNYVAPFENVRFETDTTDGVTVMFLYQGNDSIQASVTVTKVQSGYLGKPITVSNDFTATTDTWLNIDGETEYFNVYSFVANTTGTLIVTASGIPQGATLTINGTAITNTLEVAVEQDDKVEIVFSSTEDGQTANVSFS